MWKIKIPQATSKGYIECPEGGCFDGSFKTSKLRRGRVQGGGMICPTLQAADPQIYIFEGVYESEDNKDR